MTIIVDLWKKSVDVQQHFNDLELRIRNYAVTLLVAVLGATAFAMKEHLTFSLWSINFSLGVPLLGAGLIGWLSFYSLDRWGYHRLLYGAVKHGRYIEERLARTLPEITLARAIGRESPIKIWRWTIHSARKIDMFYGLISLMLLVMIGFLLIARPGGNTDGSGGIVNRAGVQSSSPVKPPRSGTSSTDGYSAVFRAPMQRIESDEGQAKH